VICQECRAARALHSEDCNCLDVTVRDAPSQSGVAAWDGLPAAIRKAILSLAEIQSPRPADDRGQAEQGQ
jgi:hypothetical protein